MKEKHEILGAETAPNRVVLGKTRTENAINL